MSDNVKRFSLWCLISHGHELVEDENGELVYYLDLLKVQRERDALRNQVQELETKLAHISED